MKQLIFGCYPKTQEQMNVFSFPMKMKNFTFILFIFILSVPARADYYRFLVNEQEALQCRFDLIKQAEVEILISSYIIQDDEIGLSIFQALLEARARGVKVCVLMDGNASQVNKFLAYHLEQNGLEMKEFYLERAAGVRRYYHRLHDKMVLVDGRKMIFGGRNLKTPYFEMHPKHNFKDRDCYVESVVCGAEARQHFYYMFNAKRLTSKLKRRKPSDERSVRIAAELLRCRAAVVSHCNINTEEVSDWSVGLEETDTPVEFVHDQFFAKHGDRFEETLYKDLGSTDALIQLLENAQHSITMENPYIVPTRKWMQAFERASKRGVQIRLLTNSMKSTDVLISHAAYMNKRKRLLGLGIEIWEYQGPKQFHAKTATIDNCVSIVGSYNIHNPSERFNTEVAVWVYDEEIAVEHRLGIEQYMLHAVQIGANNKPIPATFEGYKRASFSRRARTFWWRWTAAWAFGNLL
jgi:cardiolipin synthase C